MAKLSANMTVAAEFRRMVTRLSGASRVFRGKKVEQSQQKLANAAKSFIVDGIDRQRPGWKKLSEITKTVKGNSTILQETGNFRRAMKAWKEGSDWFAGLYPGVKGKRGQDLEMVGAVHEDGAIVPVTAGIRRWFAAMGFPLRADTKFITVPSRKWFEPAVAELEAFAPEVLDPLLDEIMKGIA
jgi:hypothetical protein